MAETTKDLFKQALKFTQENKLDKAIEAYQAILKKTPKDTRVLNNLGDLYLRKKLMIEAANVFNTLAQLLDEDGYTLRAIAICQKVVKIAPESHTIRARMAELYARQGLTAESRNQYLELADYYDRKNQVKEALEIFRKLADLDPTNLSVRTRLGNMFQKEKMQDKAAAEWTKAAEGYLKQNRIEEACSLLEKAVEADGSLDRARSLLAGEEIRRDRPDRVIKLLEPVVQAGKAEGETLKILAAAFLKKQDWTRAAEVLRKALEKEPSSAPVRENLGLALLKSGQYEAGAEILHKIVVAYTKENRWDRAEKLALEMLQSGPEDAQVRQRLVDIYQHSGNIPKLVESYAGLADLYERRGLLKNVQGIYEKLAELEPGNSIWRAKLSRQAPPEGRKTEAPPPLQAEPVAAAGLIIEEEGLEEDLSVLAAGEEEIEVEAEAEAAAGRAPAASPQDTVRDLLSRGLFSEAEAILDGLIAGQPDLESFWLRKELYRLQDRMKPYVKACFDLASFLIGRGMKKEAVAQYQEILRVDRANQQAKQALADLVVQMGAEAPPAQEPAFAAPPAEAAAAGEPLEIPEVDLAGIGEMDLEKLAEKISTPEPEASAPAAASAPPPAAAAPPEAPAQPTAAQDIEEMLAEADFYQQQGLVEEAEKLYRQALAREPGRLDVASRLHNLTEGAPAEAPEIGEQDIAEIEKGLDFGLVPPKPEVKFSVSPESDEGAAGAMVGHFSDFLTDLKKEIEEPEPAKTAQDEESLESIFQEFRQGVKDKLSAEDYETHYNLGIAYKEMGLPDEAMGEFELSAKSPKFYVDSVSMMALCHKDKGDLSGAAAAIDGALAGLAPEADSRKGLLWELAGIYEEMGERKKAVNTYLAVYEMDVDYRGIQEKLKELGAAVDKRHEKAAAAAPPAEAPTEVKEEPQPKPKAKVSYL